LQTKPYESRAGTLARNKRASNTEQQREDRPVQGARLSSLEAEIFIKAIDESISLKEEYLLTKEQVTNRESPQMGFNQQLSN